MASPAPTRSRATRVQRIRALPRSTATKAAKTSKTSQAAMTRNATNGRLARTLLGHISSGVSTDEDGDEAEPVRSSSPVSRFNKDARHHQHNKDASNSSGTLSHEPVTLHNADINDGREEPASDDAAAGYEDDWHGFEDERVALNDAAITDEDELAGFDETFNHDQDGRSLVQKQATISTDKRPLLPIPAGISLLARQTTKYDFLEQAGTMKRWAEQPIIDLSSDEDENEDDEVEWHGFDDDGQHERLVYEQRDKRSYPHMRGDDNDEDDRSCLTQSINDNLDERSSPSKSINDDLEERLSPDEPTDNEYSVDDQDEHDKQSITIIGGYVRDGDVVHVPSKELPRTTVSAVREFIKTACESKPMWMSKTFRNQCTRLQLGTQTMYKWSKDGSRATCQTCANSRGLCMR